MNRRHLIAAFLWLLTLAQIASASEPEGRLDRIKRTGIMVISHGEAGVPFSYIDKTGPIGFGVDLSKRVANAIKTHLGMSELRIRWNPVTLSTRFPMIVTNTVDLECVTTTNTRARQSMVSFSTSFFISEEGIATRRDSGIAGYPDLVGKRVAVVRGTTTEKALIERNLGLTLISERNNRQAMAALATGRADAYIASAAIAAGELLRLADAGPYHVVSTGGYKEAFGCMLPKGDAAYKQIVDAAITQLITSGEMEQIYNKWFMSPIPPHDRNAQLPLSAANRALYQAPNDNALE